MTDWEKVGVNLLRRRINAALDYHREAQWASGPGCRTCRIGDKNTITGSYNVVPAPWPCDTYKALTGTE